MESFPVWNAAPLMDYPSFGSLSHHETAHPTEPTRTTPFTMNAGANATLRIVHSSAPITLKVDALVHPISSTVKGVSSEYKHLSNRAGPTMVRELTHNVRLHCEGHGNDRLHTADVIITEAGKLECNNVLHVVAPAYTSNYRTAMTNSLSACYVRTMEAAIEQCQAKSLCFGGLADRLVRGGFDTDEAYHIALRTIKQFLIKYPNKLEAVIVLTKSEEECRRVCADIAPLYFPRNNTEVSASSRTFQTRSAGDATGAHRTLARRIRVGGAVLAAGEAASPMPDPKRQQAQRCAAVETPPASASKFTLRDFPQLDTWRKGKICIRVRDTATHRDSADGNQFTIYSIRVAETPSLPGYTVWRRYSEFLTLRDAVVEEATNHRSSELCVLATTPFPSKVWFGSMSPEVVEERRVLFDGFLRTLSSQCTDRTMTQLRGFLTPNDVDVERARSEEEEDDEEEDDDHSVSFIQDVQDPMTQKKKTVATSRKVLGNVANKPVARPSETLKIRRRIRNAASGEDAFKRTAKPPRSTTMEPTDKVRRSSGPRMHRADMTAGGEDSNYIAEGNRFITNDLL